MSLLAPVRNYGGGRELELAGADEHVCTTAAVMQQARDDEIACELGVNLHRGESCRRRKNFGACRRPAGSNSSSLRVHRPGRCPTVIASAESIDHGQELADEDVDQ